MKVKTVKLYATKACPTMPEGKEFEICEASAQHMIDKGYATKTKPKTKAEE